jgi:adenosine deaminase
VSPLPTRGLSDLHRHLDGSMRLETLQALAAERGLTVPADLRFFPGMGLAAALSRFAFTLQCLDTPDAVRQVASEACEDAAAHGVDTLELRFAPQLHGPPVPQVVDAALDGLAGRAGLILCGLYGDDPAVLEGLVDCARERPGVVGLDLAGGPAPGHTWALADYAKAFRRARELGLGRTVHAGEGRPPGEIRTAIELLHAQRVGHGTTLLRDPHVADLVQQRGVVIEACVTSNWQVGAIVRPEDHDLPRWLARGVRVAVCCDNTLLSDNDAGSELALVAGLPGMTAAGLDALLKTGREAAFRR